MSGSRARSWILLVAVASLALGARIEYREIPEYGGYFPVEHTKSNSHVVRAYWVLPRPGEDPSPSYHPPKTPEEATKRVKKYRGKGRFLKPLAPLLWLPGIATVVEYYAHVRPEQLDEEMRAALQDFVGTEVSIRVVDEDGAAISGARVHLAVYPREIPTYFDGGGLRSFAGQLPVAYTPSADWIGARVEQLPIYLGIQCECRPAFRLGVTPWEAKLEPVFEHQSDAWGNVHLTSLDFARFATFTHEGGWRWFREPTLLTVHAIVWSPGYEATGSAAAMGEPGAPVAMTVVLKPTTATVEERQAHQALTETFSALCDALEYRYRGRNRGWHRDEPAVSRAIRQLGKLLHSPELPDYLRWNAREALADLSRAAFAITAPLAGEAAAALTGEGGSASSWTPTWSGKGDIESPWSLSAKTDQWFDDIEDGLEVHRRLTFSQKLGVRVAGVPDEYFHPHGPVDVDPVADARALLDAVQALDPGHPSIEGFRAAIALADGKREQAVPHTRFLNHTDFFRLFYPGLEVEAPQAWRDSSP